MSDIIEAYTNLNDRLRSEQLTLAEATALHQLMGGAADVVGRIIDRLRMEQHLAPQPGYVWLYTENQSNIWGDRVELVFESFGAVLEHIKETHGNDSEFALPENWHPLSPLSGTGYFECHSHSVQRVKRGGAE